MPVPPRPGSPHLSRAVGALAALLLAAPGSEGAVQDHPDLDGWDAPAVGPARTALPPPDDGLPTGPPVRIRAGAPRGRAFHADSTSDGPPVLTDALLLAGGTVAYALAAPWIRPHFLEHFSLDRVRRNLAEPVRRTGVTEDDDGFFHNYVSHPVVWGGLGWVLRERGYGPWGALAVTQAHSVWWEYVVEGAWKPPSRVDVITNFVSPVVTIFALRPLARSLWGGDGADDGGDRERAAGDGPRAPSLRLRAVPAGAGGGTALVVSVPLP